MDRQRLLSLCRNRIMIEQTMQTRVGSSSPPHGLLKTQGRARMKTHGEMEAAVCDGIRHFEQEYMGRGPKDVHAHLLGDLLVVRLTGVLTAAEQHLAQSLPAEKGRDLIKQVRTHLVETARPILEAMIQEATGVKVRSLHHDISTVTGEKILVATLEEAPDFRDAKRR
jgi:uncharacterized protein YbcI